MFWARRAGPLLGLLWMDAGMARSSLCFWAGGWDIWPISLSLSSSINVSIFLDSILYDFSKAWTFSLRGSSI